MAGVYVSGMDWKAIGTLLRWGGAIVGAGQTTVWLRETLTRPNRDVLTEMMGSVVSLHSLYLGAAVGGSILTLGCGWPLFRWVWAAPARKRKREKDQREVEEDRQRDKDREITRQTKNNLQELQDRLRTEIDGRRRNRTENQETIRILTSQLRTMGFDLPEIGGEATYPGLHHRVSGLLPQVRLYGVQGVISDMEER